MARRDLYFMDELLQGAMVAEQDGKTFKRIQSEMKTLVVHHDS